MEKIFDESKSGLYALGYINNQTTFITDLENKTNNTPIAIPPIIPINILAGILCDNCKIISIAFPAPMTAISPYIPDQV